MPSHLHNTPKDEATATAVQFSIRGLLITMVLTAVGLAAGLPVICPWGTASQLQFRQTYLLDGNKWITRVRMDNHMLEASARNLQFHVDPTRRKVRTSDGQDCSICARGNR